MANPQKDKGHTQIANELLEALARTRVNGEAMQVLLVIIRKTYGFNKKEDAISISQFVSITKMKDTAVCRAINKLKAMNLIIQKDNPIANLYRFNKDYDTWKPLSKKITLSKKIITVIEKDNNRYPKREIQKTVTKDTITKDITPAVLKAPIPVWFTDPEVQEIYEYGVKKGFSANKQQMQAWAISKLLEKYPKAKLLGAVDATIKSVGQLYAPRINNFIDLEEKFISLINFYQSQNKPKGRERKIWKSPKG